MKNLMYYQHFTVLSLAIVSFPILGAAAQIQAPGVPNFHQVNEHIFRGGQPTAQGWDSIAKLGVKVVIDLRRDNEDGEHFTSAEAKTLQTAGIRYVNVPMNGVVAPSDVAIANVLALLNGPDPVFVHCKKGKDRTGTVIACYRIWHDQWKNAKAINEAKAIGMQWTQVGMKRYISHFTGVGMPAASASVATVAPPDQTPLN
jgi:uncharacterized protein (TIGR01244 family)